MLPGLMFAHVPAAGKNDDGQLGTIRTTSSAVPVKVAGITTFGSITCGGSHSCSLDGQGQAWCWGAQRVGRGQWLSAHVAKLCAFMFDIEVAQRQCMKWLQVGTMPGNWVQAATSAPDFRQRWPAGAPLLPCLPAEAAHVAWRRLGKCFAGVSCCQCSLHSYLWGSHPQPLLPMHNVHHFCRDQL